MRSCAMARSLPALPACSALTLRAPASSSASCASSPRAAARSASALASAALVVRTSRVSSEPSPMKLTWTTSYPTNEYPEKIPPTIRLEKQGATSVRITAGSQKVQIAYMFEIGKSTYNHPWRHPVFPNAERHNWHWAAQTRPLRPFLSTALLEVGLPAVDEMADEMVEMIEKAIGEI